MKADSTPVVPLQRLIDRYQRRPLTVSACSGHLEEAVLRMSGKVVEIRQAAGANLACQPTGIEIECTFGAVWLLTEDVIRP